MHRYLRAEEIKIHNKMRKRIFFCWYIRWNSCFSLRVIFFFLYSVDTMIWFWIWWNIQLWLSWHSLNYNNHIIANFNHTNTFCLQWYIQIKHWNSSTYFTLCDNCFDRAGRTFVSVKMETIAYYFILIVEISRYNSNHIVTFLFDAYVNEYSG